MSIAVFGCGGSGGGSSAEGEEPLLTAATLGEQDIRAVDEYLADPEYAGANVENGERLAMQCRACHSYDQGGAHMLGPALYGFFGRKAGSAEGFGYTAALRSADFVWTPRAMDAWLAQPAVFLPGNAMAYAGLRKQADRQAVIAYLLAETGKQPSP